MNMNRNLPESLKTNVRLKHTWQESVFPCIYPAHIMESSSLFP